MRDARLPACYAGLVAEAAGFRELAHTADWELEVWAPDLAGLLEQAAAGMYALMGVELEAGPRQRRRLEVTGDDREDLLVAFLGELLFLTESEGVGCDVLRVEVTPGRVRAELEGAPVRARAREIKAVTYHRLAIRDGPDGLVTRVVIDV